MGMSPASIFLSPLSILTALAMLLPGTSTDEAANEMHQALFASNPELHRAICAVMEELAKADPGKVEFAVANSLWTKSANPKYIKDVATIFSAEVLPLRTPEEINTWVAKKTKDMIKNIVSDLTGNIVCVLVNAITLEGSGQTNLSPVIRSRRRSFMIFEEKRNPHATSWLTRQP